MQRIGYWQSWDQADAEERFVCLKRGNLDTLVVSLMRNALRMRRASFASVVPGGESIFFGWAGATDGSSVVHIRPLIIRCGR